MRLHCVEMQRVLQTYYARVDGAVQGFGGGSGGGAGGVVFEVQDLGVSSNTPATVLYDGAMRVRRRAAALCAVNSVQLFGSIGLLPGDADGLGVGGDHAGGWAKQTRLIGVAGEGVDCTVSATGKGYVFGGAGVRWRAS